MLNARSIAVGLLVAAAVGASPAPVAAATGYTAFVDVTVATLWVRPGLARTIDRPALTNPADPRRWARSLTTAQRRWLVGRLETQALLGARVLVLSRRGTWSHVLVRDQPTPRDRRGYPGWLPTAQLRTATAFGKLLGGPFAIVARPAAWLRDPANGQRVLELSFGTRLPVVRSEQTSVLVTVPSGRRLLLRRADVRVFASSDAIPVPTGAQLVADGRRFLGLRYLWAGRSGFGFDCSGLVSLLFEARGIRIPRDADAQATAGRPVARASLRAGDLVFFGRPVTHVALYVGAGRMLESPDSSSAVRIVALAARHGYAGARRVLP